MTIRTLSALALGALAAAALAGPVKYDVKTLPTLGSDSWNFAFGINDAGYVVGTSNPYGSAGAQSGRGFVWNGSTMQEIAGGAGHNAAVDISNSGYVATWNNVSTSQAGRYDVATGKLDLLDGAGGTSGSTTRVTGIAEDGTVLGEYTPAAPKDHSSAVAWRGGSTVMEGLFAEGGGNRTTPGAIAPNGDVIARDDDTGSPTGDSWLYGNGDYRTDFVRTDRAYASFVNGVNGSGQAVGYQAIRGANGATSFQPMLWNYAGNGGGANPERALGTPLMDPVGYPLANPNAINDAGTIVGTVDGAKWRDFQGSTGYLNAFVMAKENGAYAYYDLNSLIASTDSPGIILVGANDINGRGQIVGYGYTAAGDFRAFVATPVPEPATLAALGLGALVFLKRRRR